MMDPVAILFDRPPHELVGVLQALAREGMLTDTPSADPSQLASAPSHPWVEALRAEPAPSLAHLAAMLADPVPATEGEIYLYARLVPSAEGGKKKMYFLGLSPSTLHEDRTLLQSVSYGYAWVEDKTILTYQGLWMMLAGRASTQDLAGPLFIFQEAGRQAARYAGLRTLAK